MRRKALSSYLARYAFVVLMVHAHINDFGAKTSLSVAQREHYKKEHRKTQVLYEFRHI